MRGESYKSFRFHTGSIKSADRVRARREARRAFRFHTGSIKSNLLQICPFHLEEFRFHTGSIKR